MDIQSVSLHQLADFPNSEAPLEPTQRIWMRSGETSSDPDMLPEHRLMIALIRDALRCIAKYRYARDTRGKRLFAQETQWVLSDDAGWLYAFVRVCESLDLDPNAVRRSLGLTSGRTGTNASGNGTAIRTDLH